MRTQPFALPGSCDFTCSSSRSDLMSSRVLARLPHVRRISVSSILEISMCHFPSRTPCASCLPFSFEKKSERRAAPCRSHAQGLKAPTGGSLRFVGENLVHRRFDAILELSTSSWSECVKNPSMRYLATGSHSSSGDKTKTNINIQTRTACLFSWCGCLFLLATLLMCFSC